MSEVSTEFLGKAADFWSWFSKHESKLYQTLIGESQGAVNNHPQSNPMFEKLGNRLKRVNKHFTFEFFLNREEDNKFEFFISPNGHKPSYRELIELVKSSPKSTYFIFKPFKQPHKNVKELQSMGIAYGGRKIGIKDIYFDFKEEGANKIAINLYFKEYDGDLMQAMEFMFYLLDKVIGEYYVSVLLGEIDVHKLTSKKGLSPLYELPGIVSEYKEMYQIPSVADLLSGMHLKNEFLVIKNH